MIVFREGRRELGTVSAWSPTLAKRIGLWCADQLDSVLWGDPFLLLGRLPRSTDDSRSLSTVTEGVAKVTERPCEV